jgi:hypothetical protein
MAQYINNTRYALHGMDGVHYNSIKGKTIESNQRVSQRGIGHVVFVLLVLRCG